MVGNRIINYLYTVGYYETLYQIDYLRLGLIYYTFSKIAVDCLLFLQLPEVEIKDSGEPLKFELHLKNTSSVITLAVHKEAVKTTWLTEIRKYASDVG